MYIHSIYIQGGIYKTICKNNYKVNGPQRQPTFITYMIPIYFIHYIIMQL